MKTFAKQMTSMLMALLLMIGALPLIVGLSATTMACPNYGYSSYEYGDTIEEEYNDHTDKDFDGFCDICDAVTSRFSVTVPAYLLVVLSQDGTVYAATSAEIINHSTAAVEVTAISFTTENGWTLVPYTTDMANEKVDSCQIGFLLNGTDGYYGTLENDGRWIAGKDSSIPLIYDAVVSATSDILMEEQVLTIIFVLDWAV